MIPTVENIYNLTRFHLGDTQTPGGQLFTDTFLGNLWPECYNCLYRWLDRNANKLLRKSSFWNLQPYTSYLTPAGMNILGMGKPLALRDRAVSTTINVTVAAINAAAPNTGGAPSVDLTATNHGLSNGDEVVVFGFTGMTDDINDEWFIQVINSNEVRLLGCSSVALGGGGGVGSAGVLSTGSGQFPTMPIQQLYDEDNTPLVAAASEITSWYWKGGAFRFNPVTVTRQIKMTYMLSGDAMTATSASVGIDDSLGALSLFLAGMAAESKGGFQNKKQSMFLRAIGNNNGDTTNIKGGAFYELACLGMQALNQTRIVSPRYRKKRNVGPNAYSW